jgi:hypothetical protein
LLSELNVAKVKEAGDTVEEFCNFAGTKLDGAHALEHNFKTRLVVWREAYLRLVSLEVVFWLF